MAIIRAVKLLRDLDVAGKRVFVRADLDVSLSSSNDQTQNSNETATRLINLKSTVDFLLEKGANQIVIAGHIGRPDKSDRSEGRINQNVNESESQTDQNVGKADYYVEKLSTRQLLPVLEKILGREIAFFDQFPNSNFQTPNEKIVLLENLRFWEGETKNDIEFAKKLAGFADIYVNEAFGNSHREHASMAALPKFLSHSAGLHLEEEIKVLSEVLENPKRPLVAIVGGAKLETKIPVIDNLSKHADKVLVGGELLKEFPISNFPHSATSFAKASKVKKALRDEQFPINENKVVLGKLTGDSFDIDEESIKKFVEIINSAKSVVWNGPMGMFEEGHSQGTLRIAEAIINSGCHSIVGGGETTQFLASKNLLSKFSFVSSGGGAMLEFLAGKELPGIKALD